MGIRLRPRTIVLPQRAWDQIGRITIPVSPPPGPPRPGATVRLQEWLNRVAGITGPTPPPPPPVLVDYLPTTALVDTFEDGILDPTWSYFSTPVTESADTGFSILTPSGAPTLIVRPSPIDFRMDDLGGAKWEVDVKDFNDILPTVTSYTTVRLFLSAADSTGQGFLNGEISLQVGIGDNPLFSTGVGYNLSTNGGGSQMTKRSLPNKAACLGRIRLEYRRPVGISGQPGFIAATFAVSFQAPGATSFVEEGSLQFGVPNGSIGRAGMQVFSNYSSFGSYDNLSRVRI